MEGITFSIIFGAVLVLAIQIQRIREAQDKDLEKGIKKHWWEY